MVPATNDADRAIEDRWVKDTLDDFVNHDYIFTNSSEAISDFSHFADNIVPAIHKLNDEQINDVVIKISKTLESYLPHLKQDDDADFFGGLRYFINHLLDVLDRLFRQIDFKKVDSVINNNLVSVLVKYVEKRYPCLLLLSVTNQIDDKNNLQLLFLIACTTLMSMSGMMLVEVCIIYSRIILMCLTHRQD